MQACAAEHGVRRFFLPRTLLPNDQTRMEPAQVAEVTAVGGGEPIEVDGARVACIGCRELAFEKTPGEDPHFADDQHPFALLDSFLHLEALRLELASEQALQAPNLFVEAAASVLSPTWLYHV